MLTYERGATGDTPGRGREAERPAGVAKRPAEFRVLDRGEKATRVELRVIGQGLERTDHGVGDAAELRTFHELGHTVVLGPLVQYVEEVFGVLAAVQQVFPLRRPQVLGLHGR